MATRIEKHPVTLVAPRDVELAGGVVLPAGRYSGLRKQVGMQGHSGVSWTRPSYSIELTAEEIKSFGGKPQRGLISDALNVTKYVKSGDIEVR